MESSNKALQAKDGDDREGGAEQPVGPRRIVGLDVERPPHDAGRQQVVAPPLRRPERPAGHGGRSQPVVCGVCREIPITGRASSPTSSAAPGVLGLARSS